MTLSLASWQAAALAFFAYCILVAVVRQPRRARIERVLAGSVFGLGVTAIALATRESWLQTWIWPPLVLLIAYWTSGLLFLAPISDQEQRLLWLDAQLAASDIARQTPRTIAEVLEAAYVFVYLLIPLALLLHLTVSPHPDADRFWLIVLLTDFICFACLPWIQTRPPRSIETGTSWRSSIRELNLRLVGKTSINVNTFPSGHAAEALVAALLVLDAPAPIVALMFAAAFAVAAGAVLGRYHYVLDAVTGWIVALVVFAALR